MSMDMVNTTHRKRSIIIIIVVLCLIIMGVMYVLVNNQSESANVQNEDIHDYRLITINNHDYKFNSDLELILFLGIDSEDKDSQGQSDTIQLLIIDQEQKTMKILSLSRDLMTDIRVFSASGEDLGWKEQHLGLAYSYGQTPDNGCHLAIDAISKMFGGIPIINYVAIQMNSIERLQNVVGTLSISLTNDYTSINPQWKNGKTIQLKPQDAKSFLRTRNIEKNYSNTLRMKKHKIYIESYMKQLKQLLKDDFQQIIYKLYDVYEDTTTNVSLEEISDYAQILMTYQIDFEQSFYTLEGQERVGKYHDEVYIDQKQLDDLKLKLFYKEENKE